MSIASLCLAQNVGVVEAFIDLNEAFFGSKHGESELLELLGRLDIIRPEKPANAWPGRQQVEVEVR